MRRGSITLIAPGLLSDTSSSSSVDGPDWADNDPAPTLPDVFLTLDRHVTTRRSEREDLDHCVLTRCYPQYAVDDLPVALWSYAYDADSPDPPDRPLLRADPVIVTAGARGLSLGQIQSQELTGRESQLLAKVVGTELAEHGIVLKTMATTRWYALLPEVTRTKFSSPAHAAASGIDQCLPTGDEAQSWVSLLSACQIALHDSTVNRERDERGEMPVTSVWFFGNGSIPATTPPSFAEIYGDHPLACGIAYRTARFVPELATATAEKGLLIALQSWQRADTDVIVADILARWRSRTWPN